MTGGANGPRSTRRALAGLGVGPFLVSRWASAQEVRSTPIVSVARMPSVAGFQRLEFSSIWLSTLLYDAPLAFTANGTLAGAIANGWTIDQGGLRIELSIRRDVLFTDGTPVRANDVAASIRLAADPASEAVDVWRFAAVRSVEATSDDRVVIALGAPDVTVLTSLASSRVPIVPEAWTARSTLLTMAPGSGPFTVGAMTASSVSLHRHPGYRQVGRPRLSTLSVQPSEASELRTTGLVTRAVDVLVDVPLLDVPTLRQDPEITLVGGPTDRLTMAVVNSRAPVLADPGLRQLLAAAIDRQALIDAAFAGEAEVAVEMIPATHWAAGGTPIEPLPAETVRERLRDLGYSPGVRFRLIVDDDESSVVNACVLLQDQLAYAGFALDLDLLAPAEMARAIPAGDFDLTLRYSPFWRDPHEFFFPLVGTDGPLNAGGFASDRVDRLIARGVEQADIAFRARAYVRLQELLAADMPIIPLYRTNYYDAVAPSIVGFDQNAPISGLGLRSAHLAPRTPSVVP